MLSWTTEELYLILVKEVFGLLKARVRIFLVKSTSLPRSTAANIVVDIRFASQLITFYRKLIIKSLHAYNLASHFSAILDKFRVGLTNPSFSVDPKVPGQSVSHTESPSLRYSVST